MKIFTTTQIRAWDAYTIAQEPISSVELMDRAARAFTAWFLNVYPDPERPVYIACGNGNNGGDGLAVARLLHRAFYSVTVIMPDKNGQLSPDCAAQLVLLPRDVGVIEEIKVIKEIKKGVDFIDSAESKNDPNDPNDRNDPNDPNDPNDLNDLNDPNFPISPQPPILIDALFGSGLNRPLEGDWAQLVDILNDMPFERVSIDVPSGLFADRHTDGPCIRARRTFSFETPKLAFFFPENAGRVGEWAYGPIGLHPAFATEQETPYHFSTLAEVRTLLRPRATYSHKGSYGHALLVAGSYGKMGAAVLAARAALRSGVGLLSVQAPQCGGTVLQTAVPEAMYLPDPGAEYWTQAPDSQGYTAIGLGPGLGQEAATAKAMEQLLRSTVRPLVLDADALNLLAQHPAWWSIIPPDSILTPHPKEFERLFGTTKNDFERNELQRRRAREHRVFIILKGAYTAIAGPDGRCRFNSTGNPGMATGGSGDVLTGILTGLLAQGYAPENTSRLGVLLHGLAGDLAAADLSEAALLAGDIVDYIGKAWLALQEI